MSDEERDEERRAREALRARDEAEPAAASAATDSGPGSTGAASPGEPPFEALVQSRLDWSARCEMLEDGVSYERARPFSRMATRVPFEAIPDDPIRELRISRTWACATSLCFGLLLWSLQPLASLGGSVEAWIVVLAATGLLGSAFMLRYQSGHFLVYPCEGKLIEFADRGGDEELRAFLEQLQLRKARYLSETYGPRPSDDSSGFDPLADSTDDPGGYRH